MRRGRLPGGAAARLPDGYALVVSPLGSWVARRDCADAIEQGAADFLLRGPARRGKRAGTGRGPLARLDLKGQASVGKRAIRGGLGGRLLGGLYLGAGRALAQIGTAERLRQVGIPTPEVLAVGWRRALLLFSAQAVVTRAVPGAQNLYEAARQGPLRDRRRAILLASADLVRRMHDAGFLHPDLNVTNLVLEGAGGRGRLFVVDLDKARFTTSITPAERLSGLARMLRSYDKWIAAGWPLTPREEMLFLRSYCRSDRAMLREFQRRLLGQRRRRRAARSTSSTAISSRQKGFPDGAGGHSWKKRWRQGEHG